MTNGLKITLPRRRIPGIAIEPLHILVTGFGRFPGAAKNPTAQMILALGAHRARLARLGVALELHVLPVVYAEIAPRLDALTRTVNPDAILHFGLAGRRKAFCVETRALNRIGALRPDAAGARAKSREIVAGAPFIERSSFPSRRIAAALAGAGIKTEISADAGDYICNQTLYLSLAASPARLVGFIHAPPLAPFRSVACAAKRRRPSLDAATRAAVIAILVTAAQLRRARAQGATRRLTATRS